MARAILALWFKDVVIGDRAWVIERHDDQVDQDMVE
jgi:hypothetical protein